MFMRRWITGAMAIACVSCASQPATPQASFRILPPATHPAPAEPPLEAPPLRAERLTPPSPKPSPSPPAARGWWTMVGVDARVSLLNTATGETTALTNAPPWEGPGLPRVSRSGRVVAYVANMNGPRRMVAWDVKADREISLPGLERVDAVDPDLDGEGRRLVFIDRSPWREAGLVVYDLASGRVLSRPTVPTGITSVRSPTLSGDGQVLAYVGTSPRGDADVYLTTLITGRPLSPATLNSASDDLDPALNQDGTRLIFVSGRAGSLDLFALNLADSRYLDLSPFNAKGMEREPRWIGNDDAVAYMGERQGANAVMVGRLNDWR